MRPLPTDNQRPAILLAILAAVTAAVVAATVVLLVHYRTEDRGYTTELRGALRKYGAAVAVPGPSVQWLARVHERDAEQVRKDLAKEAKDPTAYDPDAPLHLQPNLMVSLYLAWGAAGLWVALFCGGLLLAAPVVSLVNRMSRPPRPPPPDPDAPWQ